MRWGSRLAAHLSPLVDFAYPPRCLLCGCAIAEQSGLCAACWSELEFPREPSCASCGRPLPSDGEHGGRLECGVCLATPPRHDGIIAATRYNDAARKLVLDFKHGRKIALARFLGRLMASQLPEDRDTLLVPVPLHRGRLWRRGFNQSALLARELARLGKGQLIVDGLERFKATPSLSGLGKRERKKALSGTIRVRRSKRNIVRGRSIIVVDDVLTSGATSDACVAALRKAKAKQVRIACFARVLD